MKRISSLLKLASELALLGILVLVIVLAIRLIGTTIDLPLQQATIYPPPQGSPRAFPTEVIVTKTPRPTPGPFEKGDFTPSPSEIVAEETSRAEEAAYATQYFLITPPTPPTPVYYPVNSIEDLPKVVFNDPFFGNVNNGDFGFCLQANQPGEAIFVKSLNENEMHDYYMLPFFKDGELCSLYTVSLTDHMGSVDGWSSARGMRYPPVSAEEAIGLVKEKTGIYDLGEPYLGFRLLREAMGPDWPFWVVTTTDGQTFYVIYTFWASEDSLAGLGVKVWDANEVHPIRP
jgi:hypothetical protein